MIIISSELKIDDLRDGVKIMSIESRYIFKEQNNETGYNSLVFWNKERNILPRKLYKVKLPYSLGMIHWYKMKKSQFDMLGNNIYSNDIINVSFDRASKVKATDEDGNIKYKPRIKKNKRGYSFEIVEELKTDISIDELRKGLYGGFTLDNEKYVVFMRSPGKARVGEVLYIKEKLLDDFLDWARMGIDFKEIKDTVDVAGLKAAESLILSSIKDEVTIKTNEILLIPDKKVPYKIPKGKASITEMGDDGMAKTSDNEEETIIENDIFDGQSLLSPEFYHDGKSMILLRNRFFKSAAFCFDIQRWFKDTKVTDVKQLNGYTLADKVEDIKLITTPNSLKFMKQKKYIKFDGEVDDLEYATFEYWLQHIKEDDCVFGVVKNEYASGFIKGYNYQVDNSLDLSMDEMRELLKYEFDRIKKAKNDNDYFVNEFIEKKERKKTKDEYFSKYRFDNCVCELYKLNSDIQYTDFFKTYKNNMLNKDYKKLLKLGKYKLKNSDYCVVCSNPFEMMQHACNIKQDDWVRIHQGREAYCKYYPDKQDLIATRSPHIYSGNVVCLHNTYHEWFDRYMRLSDNIVVINSIESDIMDRCNSMDFDSDTVLLSSNYILVEKAKYCEENFPTPICKIVPKPKERYYTIDDFIDCDKTIADAKIGEIVDLSQLLESYYHDVRLNPDIESERKEEILKYLRNQISKLASLSGCEIDRAKREFPVNTEKELNKISDYIADHKNTDNLLHGIVKTGDVEYIVGTVNKKYLEESPDIKEDDKKDYEIIQKVMGLNERNDNISASLVDIKDSEKIKEQQKNISENKKEIDKLLKSRIKTKKNVLAKPNFFKAAFPNDEKAYYTKFNCPMDYLQEIIENEYPRKKRQKEKDEDGNDIPKLKLIDFFVNPIEYNKKGKLKRANDKHAQKIVKFAKEYENQRKALYANKSKNNGLEFDAEFEKRELFKNAVDKVAEMRLTKQTMYSIINMLYGSNQAKSHNNNAREYGKTIMDILYNSHKELLLSIFKKKAQEREADDKVS